MLDSVPKHTFTIKGNNLIAGAPTPAPSEIKKIKQGSIETHFIKNE